MTPIIDLAIGFRWDETWCCDQYRTTLDLGWEHHIWFDQNHRNKNLNNFTNGDVSGFGTYSETTGDLGLGGFVLRLRLDLKALLSELRIAMYYRKILLLSAKITQETYYNLNK